MDLFLSQFAKLFPEINLALGAGIMIFARFLGLMQFAPGFNRKEIPTIARLSFALIITVIVASVVKIVFAGVSIEKMGKSLIAVDIAACS